MDNKEIKSTVSNLEKSSDDATTLKLLHILSDGVVPTEKLLRETKVGVAVNKFRTSHSPEIAQLVKKMIRGWRDVVQSEKKKKAGSPGGGSGGSGGGEGGEGANAGGGSGAPSGAAGAAGAAPAGVARTPKTDGINTTLYDNSTRNASVSALYTALAIERSEAGAHVLAVARDIENEVCKAEYMAVNDGYRNKLRTLTMNLRNKKNPALRERLLTKQISPRQFVAMSPNEMAPEALKQEIEKLHRQNLFDAQGATEKRAVTDRFTCGKCKHKKVSYYQMQTRLADEPLTTFCTCENCGNRWKFL